MELFKALRLKPAATFLLFALSVTLCTLAFAAEEKQNVAVTVNGVAITEAEVEEVTGQIIPGTAFHRDITPDKKARYRQEAVQKLIDRELLYQEAVRLGMKVADKDIQKVIEDLKGRFKSKADFTEALKKRGLTESSLKKRIRKNMLAERLMKEKVEEPSVPPADEVETYYKENKPKFMEPETIKLSEIFIHIPPGADEETRTKKQQKADEVLRRMKAGENLCDLASKYSEDDWRVKCGDIGYVHRGRLDETLEKEAWEMKEGEVKSVFLEMGIMVVKLQERRPERQLSFEEVKDKLKRELTAGKRKKLGEEYLSSLRAKAKIEIYQ